jgi:hypothetical protein
MQVTALAVVAVLGAAAGSCLPARGQPSARSADRARPPDAGSVPSSEGPASCPGVFCRGRCRPAVYGCGIVIRSQMGDRCNAEAHATGLACGPRNPLPDVGICDVGVVHRVLVDAPSACTEAMFRRITREGCEAYRKKNGAKPLDEYDPDRAVRISRRIELYDRTGNMINQRVRDGFLCPPPPDRRRLVRPGR